MLLSEFRGEPHVSKPGLAGRRRARGGGVRRYLISHHRAEETMRGYVSCFRTTLKIAVGLGVCPYPMTLGDAMPIFAQFAYEERTLSTNAAMRHAVAMMHELVVNPDSIKDNSLKQVWKEIWRMVGVGNPKRKIALYRGEVGEMIAIARDIRRDDMAALLAVHFQVALRVSEMLNLEVRDVVRRGGRNWVGVRKSKTVGPGETPTLRFAQCPGRRSTSRR